MSVNKRKVYYNVDHYLSLDSFRVPKTKNGLRRVPLSYKILNLTVFAVLAVFLTGYLYLQALSFEVENGLLPEGSALSSLFFTSLGGAALALPLIALIVWFLRKSFVQPVFIYVNMFLHGAGFSVLASLVMSGFTTDTYNDIIEFTQSNPLSFFATVHAPVFEELFKGVGLLFLLMSLPFFVRTVHDGVIYGMLVGFGFAFTENIQYFVQHGNTAEGFIFLLFMRIFASLLTHAVFTAATGLVMAYFWCKYGTFWRALLGWLAGVVVAIALHALWNGASSIGLFLVVYVLLFLPLFLAVTVLMRKSADAYDSSYISVLDRYRDSGWFSQKFYGSLFPKAVRKQNFRFMDRKTRKERRYLASALSELVFIRQSIDNGVRKDKFVAREKEILIGLFLHQKAEKDKQA